MNKPALTSHYANSKGHARTIVASEVHRPFRLTTALPVGISWRDWRRKEYDGSAVLREVSSHRCLIDTRKSLDVGSSIRVRVGVSHLDCIVRDIKLAPDGFTAKLQILPTRNGAAFLLGLERLLNVTAVSRTSGNG